MPVTNYYTVNREIIGERTTGSPRVDYLTDALGSVTATVNQSAQVVNTYRYKPYGALLAKTGTGPDPAFGWVGSQGYRPTKQNFSDFYVRARHYDSTMGRWPNVDPIGYADALNLFCYVNANPVLNMDFTGTCVVESASYHMKCIFRLRQDEEKIVGTFDYNPKDHRLDGCKDCKKPLFICESVVQLHWVIKGVYPDLGRANYTPITSAAGCGPVISGLLGYWNSSYGYINDIANGLIKTKLGKFKHIPPTTRDVLVECSVNSNITIDFYSCADPKVGQPIPPMSRQGPGGSDAWPCPVYPPKIPTHPPLLP